MPIGVQAGGTEPAIVAPDAHGNESDERGDAMPE
jgi:hypothetical protein